MLELHLVALKARAPRKLRFSDEDYAKEKLFNRNLESYPSPPNTLAGMKVPFLVICQPVEEKIDSKE